MIGEPDNGDPKPVLRPARVTDLPAIYRGELAYIRQWEPQHEHAWQMAAERHLALWVENFERLTIACVDDQLVGYSLWADELGHAELCTVHVGEAYRRGVGSVDVSRTAAPEPVLPRGKARAAKFSWLNEPARNAASRQNGPGPSGCARSLAMRCWRT